MTLVMPDPGDRTGDVLVTLLEVATTSADTLRAGVRVSGPLAADTVTMLAAVLRTHIVAGRRYLRVDLGEATIGGPEVIACLVRTHRTVVDLGGMLALEHAGPDAATALRDAGLYVN